MRDDLYMDAHLLAETAEKPMLQKRKHSHYFKDVSQLTEVDVYRVCQLFNVDDPSGAIQHAIKKLLVAGGRGAGKDLRKDIQEAVDTLQRKLDLLDGEPPRVLGMRYNIQPDYDANGGNPPPAPVPNFCTTVDDLYRYLHAGQTAVYITEHLHKKLQEGIWNSNPKLPV